MSEQQPPKQPAWWKNTYFWLAGILLVIGIFGLVGGDAVIRDPGQKKESSLWLLYFGAAIVMVFNGVLSHRLTLRDFEDKD